MKTLNNKKNTIGSSFTKSKNSIPEILQYQRPNYNFLLVWRLVLKIPTPDIY